MQEYASMRETKKILGVSSDSLRRWEKKGIIKAYRSPGGHRYFLRSDLQLLGSKYSPTKKAVVINKKPLKHSNSIDPIYIYLLIFFVILNIILFIFYIM